MSTRRDLLKTAATAVALPASGQHPHGEGGMVQIAKSYKPKVLMQGKLDWVASLVDLIIPRSDTPGASDAGVPVYIDRVLRRNASTRTQFLAGMAQLDTASTKKFGVPFLKLDSAKQIELLTAISAEKS